MFHTVCWMNHRYLCWSTLVLAASVTLLHQAIKTSTNNNRFWYMIFTRLPEPPEIIQSQSIRFAYLILAIRLPNMLMVYMRKMFYSGHLWQQHTMAVVVLMVLGGVFLTFGKTVWYFYCLCAFVAILAEPLKLPSISILLSSLNCLDGNGW